MLFEKIKEATTFIQSKIGFRPELGIILGSGLGSLSDDIAHPVVIQYNDIPYFPKSTVAGHEGKLFLGSFSGKPVMIMSGRFHYYEGYDMETVTFPIRIMKALGIPTLLIFNAAGAMNPAYRIGDIMFLKDHINLFPEHPLRGANDERLGPRFPDMSEPYDPDILAKAGKVAQELQIITREGIYVGLQGPTFETPAEYAYLRAIGGDAVGMSTVPEVIVAKHAGMKTFAASIITDIGRSDTPQAITHREVLAAAHAAAPKLGSIIKALVAEL